MAITVSCRTNNEDYLTKAIEVSNWLETQKIETAHGPVWVDQTGSDNISLSLSSGVAGKVAFYIALYNATGNEKYLNEIISGSNYIANNLPVDTASARAMRGATSLYGNMLGGAFVLVETYKLTGEPKWQDKAITSIEILNQLAAKSPDFHWNDFNDILFGNTGTGLFLLYMYKETGDKLALDMAIRVAEGLNERAIKSQDSIYWYFNQQGNFNLPNFSHGAAGIGYFFASLYEITSDQQYLKMSEKIGIYLDHIAWRPDGAYLLPYGLPDADWDREFDIGWAHGPAGTGRFFVKMYQITGEERWKDKALACIQGLKLSGTPGTPHDRFGNESFPVDVRFGNGGVADYLIGLKKEELFQDEDYLNTIMASLDSMSHFDNENRHWKIPKYGFMRGEEGDSAVFTGYFYGAAGLGLQYVRRHMVENGIPTKFKFPDSPF